VTLILHPQPKASLGRSKRAARPMTAKEALQAKAARRGLGGQAKPNGARAEGEPAAAGMRSASLPGPIELRDEWLRAEAADANHCLSAAAEGATELIAAWQQHANVAALTAVACGRDAASGGEHVAPARKAARRALNVLRARGVAIPEAAPAHASTGRAPLLGADEPEPPVATFVPPDANGMTFFSITQRLAGGRYRVADVVLREGLGLLHASSGRLPGKQIRRWKARVEARLGTSPVDVPVEWARHRLAEARKQNATSGQLLPLGLDGCEALFTPIPDTPPPHPAEELEGSLSATEIAQASASSAALHNDPEFRSWLPDRSALDELLRQVGAKLGLAGGTDQPRVDQVLGEELDGATDRFFTPEGRTALAARMRDSAISVRKRAGDAAARHVLCVAEAVREAGIITSPPHEIPFLVSFFRKAVAALARQSDGRIQVPVPKPGAAPEPSAEPPSPTADLLQGATAEGETEGDSNGDDEAPAR
jgi:hypothetical protein